MNKIINLVICVCIVSFLCACEGKRDKFLQWDKTFKEIKELQSTPLLKDELILGRPGAFKYIDSGLACTILFIYPTFVAILGAIFYKEKLSKTMTLSILIISFGIFLLYGGNNGKPLNLTGVLLSLTSAVFYALYMVGVKNFKSIKHIKKDTFNFYIMLLGLMVYVVNSRFCTQIEPINSPIVLICAILIAILPTIISIETINIAIKLIGSTKTALLGALEPISAIVFSLLFFGGVLTFKISVGVFLILSGVSLVIMKK